MPMPKRKRREPELSTTIGRTIVAAISTGNFPTVACRLAGISPVTLEKWLARGEAGEHEQPYADFAEAYRQAEAKCESAVVKTLKGAVGDDWRAGVQFLARRFPDRWSDHAGRLAVFGADDNPALQQAFQINLHLSHEEGGVPTIGSSPAIDVTPREQPPQDRHRTPSDLSPAVVSTRTPSRTDDLNAEIRGRGLIFPLRPEKKRPQNGGNGDPDNWN
jgi:hypothetical protein